MSNKFPEETLSFSPFELSNDLSHLDCREQDGSDPLGVHEFIHKHAKNLHEANLTRVYVVRHNNQIVAAFSLSMFMIKAQKLANEEQVRDSPVHQYPAVLLGQMCVDIKYRGRDIGKHICKFSLGLASNISKRVGCMCLVLHTNQLKAPYYQDKCGFTKAKEEPNDKMVWMYKRVI